MWQSPKLIYEGPSPFFLEACKKSQKHLGAQNISIGDLEVIVWLGV